MPPIRKAVFKGGPTPSEFNRLTKKGKGRVIYKAGLYSVVEFRVRRKVYHVAYKKYGERGAEYIGGCLLKIGSIECLIDFVDRLDFSDSVWTAAIRRYGAGKTNGTIQDSFKYMVRRVGALSDMEGQRPMDKRVLEYSPVKL